MIDTSQKPDLVYIASSSYSGSTLLAMLLNAHPDISTIGELKGSVKIDPAEYSCSCGELLCDCSFWKKLICELDDRNVSFDLDDFGTHFRANGSAIHNRILQASVRGPRFESCRQLAIRLLPSLRKHYEQVLSKNRSIIEAVRSLQSGEVFLDCSKNPIRLLYLQQAGLWRIKVIHLIRDGRGVACSHRKHNGVSISEASAEWRLTHEECRRMRTRFHPADWLSMRHEDLCRDPAATMRGVYEFLRLDPGRGTLDFRTVEHHIRGNGMRLNGSSTIRLDEHWKTVLTPAELREFDDVAGELNRAHGYD